MVAIARRADPTVIPPFTTAPSVHEIALGAAHNHGDHRARAGLATILADLATILADLLALVSNHDLDPMVTETVPLEAVPGALAHIAERHTRGKTVAIVN